MTSFLSSLISLFRGSNLSQQLQDVGVHTVPNADSLTLQNRAGQHITLDANSIIIQDTSGTTITLDAAGIRIQSSSAIKIESAQIALTASQVSLNSPMVKASGVIQCDTIIANSVVGSSYTPGAGNIS